MNRLSNYRARRASASGLALLAVCTPVWLAYSVSPSATFLNQATAVVAWGCWLVALLIFQVGGPQAGSTASTQRGVDSGAMALFAALMILAVLCAVAWLWQGLPLGLALSACWMLMATMVVVATGVVLARSSRGGLVVGIQTVAAFRMLAWGLVAAGLGASLIGVLQVFAPDLANGVWLAASSLQGRATGNFRQPNHLGTLLLWAMVALVGLGELSKRPARNLLFVQLPVLTLLMVGVVLSASRTAVLALVVLVAWAFLDRRLRPNTRGLLAVTPVLYALVWWGLTVWAQTTGNAFGGAARFSADGDISSSRFAIWRDTLALIAAHPWTGVGWGHFNFAWSLTPFPHRPTAFFDHSHNLFLQLAVELGLPLALLVIGLLAYAFWRATVNARRASGMCGVALRCCWVMLFMVALHSQLEYPLWYAYFLFPAAFMWGLCLGGEQSEKSRVSRGELGRLSLPWRPVLCMGSLLMVVVGLTSVLDYWRVVVIYAPPAGAPPLSQRVEEGKRSLFFAHHAHYAAATTAIEPEQAILSFEVTTRHLLDTRLMVAWAKALNAAGDVERARHVAARLREFRNQNAAAFFQPCDSQPPAQPLPFQCTPPSRVMDWREFK